MNSTPLDQLADIHLPASVSWWPLAPGWWLLLSLILLGLVGYYFWRKHHARNYYRKLALHELHALNNEYQQQHDPAQYLQKLSVILKRTALSAQPVNFNASIKGDDWLAWLDAQCAAMKATQVQPIADNFTQGSGRALLSGPYQKTPQVDISQLHALAHYWIENHANHWQRKHLPVNNARASGVNNV